MDERNELFIGGAWVAPSTGERIEIVSPHSEERLASVPAASAADVDRAVAAARLAFDEGPWPTLPPGERIEAVRRFASCYAERRADMVSTIVAELGAPVRFAKTAQVGLPTHNIGVLASIAESYPWDETRPGAFGRDVLLRREPVGVVAAVVPWNMPQFLTIAKVVPALLAGCTVVLKPSPEAALDAQLLAEV
jgi:acyl-CoA reductase-like NAD-dependent aldehyde dehydrogenase